MIARGESGSVLDKSDRNRARGFVPNFAYPYLMESFAGKKVKNPRAEKQFNKFFKKGGFGNVERDDRISTVGFQIAQVDLTPDLLKLYNEQPGSRAFTQGFEDHAIKELKFNNAAKSGKNIKPLYGATSSAVDGYRITGDPNPKSPTTGLAEFLEVKGGGLDTLSVANKFGRVLPENLGRFTQSSLGINYLNMLFKEGIPDDKDTVRLKNILAVPNLKGARKGNYNRPFSVKSIEANRAKNAQKRIGAASGFIPNFAKTNSAIDLGNLNTIPNELGNKVVSLIHPGLSEGYQLKPATAKYLKNEYTGNIPVAGIDQNQLKSQLPDLDKNLGDLLVREANQFGQALGGFNFLQSAKDLPNYGAAKGAVGVAFEGGVQTLLQKRLGQKQNAGIDFPNVTPKLRRIFNEAPGMYDAKSSPGLTNEVLQKLLNETRPGATVQKSSGKAGKEYVAKRSAAIDQLRKEGVTGSVAIRQALRDRFGIVGKAAGYIPNFAAIQAPLQAAINDELASGSRPNQIGVDTDSRLKASGNKQGFGVWSTPYESSLSEGINMAKKAGINPKTKGRENRASGFIPNFAETPESSAASLGTVTSALVSQLGFLAIVLQGSGQQYKESLKELTQTNVTQAKINSKNLREQINEINIEPSLLDAKQRRKARTPEQQAQRNAAAQELRNSRDKEKTAARGTGGQKLGAGVRAGGFALGIAAPILAQTLSQAIPQETKEGRVAAAGVGSLGNIGAAAATGAVFGPIGAAVGAAAGALLEIPNFVGALSTNFPELQAAVQKSSQELTKFSDAGSRLLTSFESLESSLKDPNASQDLINKASDAYAKALTGLSLEDQKRLEQAAKIGKLEEEYAKILSEKTGELQSRESAAEAGRIAGEAETTNNLINAGIGAATVIPGIGPLVSALDSFGVIDAIRPNALESGSKEDKSNQQAFMSQILQGKTGEDAVGAIQNAGGTNFIKELLQIQPGDTKGLENLLNKTIPEGAGKADFVAAQVQMANNGTAAFGNVINSLGTGFTKSTVEAKAADKAGKALAAAQRVEIKAKEAAVKATEQIIDSLQRNIRMAQMAADTNRALAKANSEFQRNTAFADTFSRPTETVSTIVGQGAPLAEAFTLREAIAKIGFDQINQIEGVKSLFVNDINESIRTAFQEGVGETTAKATGEGTAADIEKGNKEILKPLAGQQEKAFAVVQDVLNKTLSGGGEINTEALLSDISNSLKEANINGETIQKITTQVREAGTKGNLEIEKLRNDSINEFKTLAKEQSQRILISKIGQAQKFGGGIGEFTDPQKSGEGLFSKVIESTKGFNKFQGQQADFRFDYKPGSSEFKYGYGAAQTARQEMAPEYGRAALDLTDQLQAFTGYTPNADGKAVKAGEAGLKEFYDRQLKELQTVAKDSSTPQIVKDEINAALKEVDKLGGTKNIAKLQVAQRTGALTESTFQEITGKFQSPVLEALKEQAKSIKDPEDRARFEQEIQTLSSDILISSDPTVKAINVTNNILKQMLKASDIEYQPILSSPTPTSKIESKSRGYIPAFNQESRAISRGVGGARAGDKPQFIPNLNGSPAFVNSGEKLVDNYGGSGQTAVLTRNMQNAMVAAKGFIPNFAEPSPELLKRFLEVVDSPEELKKLLRPFQRDFQMTGRTFGVDPKKMSEVIDIGPYGGMAAKSFKQFSWQDLVDLGLFTQGDLRNGQFDLKNVGNYEEVINDLTPKARTITAPSSGLTSSTAKVVQEAGEQIPKAAGPLPPAMQMQTGAKTSVTEAVENAGKAVSSRSAATASIKPTSFFSSAEENAILETAERNAAGAKTSVTEAVENTGKAVAPKTVSVGATTSGVTVANAGKKVSTSPFLPNTKGPQLPARDYFDDIARNAGFAGNKTTATPTGIYKTIIDSLKSGGRMADVKMEDLQKLAPDKLKELFDLGLLDPKKFDISKVAKFGGNILKGGVTGIVTNLGANYAKDKALQAVGIDKNTYIGGVIDELSKSAIAAGSGSAGGGLIGTVIGLGTETLGKLGTLGSSLIDLAKVSNQNAVSAGAQKKLDELARSEGFKDWNDREFGPNSWRGKRLKGAEDKRNKSTTEQAAKTKLEQESAEKARLEQIRKNNIAKGISNPRAATKDDIDAFYGRGKYATLESKERTDYENQDKISGLIANNQRAKFGVALNEEAGLFKDPIQENIDKGARASQAFKPTVKSETVGLINGRPAIEWENDAKIDAADEAAKRGEITQENANKTLEAQLSKKTINNRRKERAKTSPKIIGGQGNRPATQIDSSGTGVPVPKTVSATPAEIERERQESVKPKSAYPGGISLETAQSIVQELDANYNEAIRNSKSPDQAKSWAQTQQRYRLLYSSGKYKELDAFYKSLQKGSGYNSNYGQGTGRRGESVQNLAKGFIPNFAQNYISNLAGLEAGLSGESPAMGYDKKIGAFMYNKGQSKSGNLNEIISKDHPEGLKNAMKNSMKMQKNVGVMSKGSIPNFAVTDQSFAQLESSFNTNTSALTTLAGGIESLNNAIANLSLANLNNIPAQTNAGTQPAAATQQAANQSSNIGPFNVVVNSSEGDVSVQLTTALDKLKSEILSLVNVKVAPTVPSSQYSPSTFSNG